VAFAQRRFRQQSMDLARTQVEIDMVIRQDAREAHDDPASRRH